MKASNKVKGKFHEIKGETNQKLRKLTNDPTLEGKNENKVGRVQRKIGRAEKALQNDTACTEKTATPSSNAEGMARRERWECLKIDQPCKNERGYLFRMCHTAFGHTLRVRGTWQHFRRKTVC